MQDVSRETLTFRNGANETALPMRQLGSFLPGEGVGGAGVHWNGATWRWLPWDHEPLKLTLARYAGACAFPQNAGKAPTGPVGALAYWTADAIKQLPKESRTIGTSVTDRHLHRKNLQGAQDQPICHSR